jgi:hypothetical protein
MITSHHPRRNSVFNGEELAKSAVVSCMSTLYGEAIKVSQSMTSDQAQDANSQTLQILGFVGLATLTIRLIVDVIRTPSPLAPFTSFFGALCAMTVPLTLPLSFGTNLLVGSVAGITADLGMRHCCLFAERRINQPDQVQNPPQVVIDAPGVRQPFL